MSALARPARRGEPSTASSTPTETIEGEVVHREPFDSGADGAHARGRLRAADRAARTRRAPTPTSTATSRRARTPRRVTDDPPAVRWALTALALLFLGAFVLVPAATVVVEALRDGAALWWESLRDSDALAAIRLTLLVAATAVPLNALFGLAAAWSVTRFRYRGRTVLVTLVDLPFGISPVISGMVTVLLFGAHGWFGPWLSEHGVKVVFAVPGIVLATVFVTFPFVARELIPFMEEQGVEEEEAALVLGASGWQLFTKVTLPNIKWSLLYGVILCNARAMGEFGAVSVVSGHVRGLTNTIPLHVEILHGEYQFRAAFAVASLLFLLALVTLVAKKTLEWKQHPARREAAQRSTP